jgi:hypothetical protein
MHTAGGLYPTLPDAQPTSPGALKVEVEQAETASSVPLHQRFIKLTNKGSQAVDVSDWTLGSASKQAAFQLPAGEGMKENVYNLVSMHPRGCVITATLHAADSVCFVTHKTCTISGR